MDLRTSVVTPPHRELLRQRELSDYRGIHESLSDRLDPITNLVRELCNVPIAGVSIVDADHVLLKSRVGIDADCIERTGAFCAHAVESSEPFFEVPNALQDPRFATNPLVVSDHHIRSYAAAPLTSPHGYHIGRCG